MANRIAIQSGYTLPSFDGLRRKKRKSSAKRKVSKKKGAVTQRALFKRVVKSCSKGKFENLGYRSYRACVKAGLS